MDIVPANPAPVEIAPADTVAPIDPGPMEDMPTAPSAPADPTPVAPIRNNGTVG